MSVLPSNKQLEVLDAVSEAGAEYRLGHDWKDSDLHEFVCTLAGYSLAVDSVLYHACQLAYREAYETSSANAGKRMGLIFIGGGK